MGVTCPLLSVILMGMIIKEHAYQVGIENTIILVMNYNQILLRENRHLGRVPLHPPTHSDLRKVDHRHRLSQPKAPTQGIKIKKGKLPSDFFLKKEVASRAHPPSSFDLEELP